MVSLNKLQRNHKITAQEYNHLVNELNRLNRIRGLGGVIVRNHATGIDVLSTPGETVSRQWEYARIVQSLSRGDVDAGEPERNYYLISLELTAPAAWAAGIFYDAGVSVSFGGSEYTCLVPHTSTAATDPISWPASWSENTGLYVAYVYHYDGDLLEAMPWFQVGDTVLVLSNGSNYDILETVTRIENKKNEGTATEERIYSIAWSDYNSEDWKASAVYA